MREGEGGREGERERERGREGRREGGRDLMLKCKSKRVEVRYKLLSTGGIGGFGITNAVHCAWQGLQDTQNDVKSMHGC